MAIDLICTIGPASSSAEILRQLIEHGMTIARLNMSHGDHRSHQQVIRNIRDVSHSMGKKVKILGDLQGSKIRLGEVADGTIGLETGQTFLLHTTPITGNRQEASVDYPSLVDDVKLGARILINDGAVQLSVTRVAKDYLETKVISGGMIGSHKGVNLPSTRVTLPAIREKDKQDIRFLLLEHVDMIACSFIREAKHIEEIRRFAGISKNHPPMLIAKIETQQGIREFSRIREVADGIMVARGDLGVELPYEWVPLLQKAMIRECKQASTFVIVATQMLQSMLTQPIPTRAEVTDIFQAVLDGTDAVMLSAESASGDFPVESVDTLRKVATFAERMVGEAPFDLADMLELVQGSGERELQTVSR